MLWKLQKRENHTRIKIEKKIVDFLNFFSLSSLVIQKIKLMILTKQNKKLQSTCHAVRLTAASHLGFVTYNQCIYIHVLSTAWVYYYKHERNESNFLKGQTIRVTTTRVDWLSRYTCSSNTIYLPDL